MKEIEALLVEPDCFGARVLVTDSSVRVREESEGVGRKSPRKREREREREMHAYACPDGRYSVLDS